MPRSMASMLGVSDACSTVAGGSTNPRTCSLLWSTPRGRGRGDGSILVSGLTSGIISGSGLVSTIGSAMTSGRVSTLGVASVLVSGLDSICICGSVCGSVIGFVSG